MFRFDCGSPVCSTHFTADTKDDLMREVAMHIAVKHHVPQPSKSLVQFVEANTIREV